MPTPSTDALIRMLPYPAVLEGEEHRVVAVSTPFRRLFLLDDQGHLEVPSTMEALLAAIAPVFLEPDDTAAIFREASAARNADAVESSEAPQRLYCADGRTFDVRFTPFVDEVGTEQRNARQQEGTSGGIWHLWDATEVARAAEATEQAEALAEHAVEVRHSFVSAMSHEIKTPMNAVVGMAHLLAETNLDSTQAELVDALRRSVDHLLGLLTDVLDFSRLETGVTAFAAEPFDLRRLVDTLHEQYAPEAEARGVAFRVELDEFPPSLIGDLDRLQQVLGNLLDNALTFTHEGEICLRARVERVQGGRAFFCFEVADTGIGIDPLQQAQLFDPMAHVRAAASAGRTGLGLAILRQIVEQQGGTVTLASALGVGSTFTVRLSFPTDAASDFRQTPGRAIAAPVADTIEPDALAEYRILVVDDHPLNRLLVERLLHSWGASVELAEDGMQALQRMEDTDQPTIDLIVMDVQMPVLDGLDATRAIRATVPSAQGVPIVALTAATGTQEREAVFAAGMDDYIGKPFAPHHLYARLHAHLEGEGAIELARVADAGMPGARAEAAVHHPTVTTDKAPSVLPTPAQTLVALDLDLLQVHAMGDETFAEHLLRTFVTQTDRVVEVVGEAYASADWETVRLLTHKVRPSLRMVGLDRLEAVAHGLDEETDALMRGTQAHPSPDFGERLEALVACGRAVCAYLRETESIGV